MCKYELSIEILYAKDHGTYYMNIENFYFYSKSNVCGALKVTFMRVDVENAKEVIENLKLVSCEDDTHIKYKSKARLRSEKCNKALAGY